MKDLSGNGISQYMSYLIKLHNIDYSLEKSAEWAQIQHLRRLRNCIVHHGGKLDENTEQVRQLRDYVRSETMLSIQDETNEIILTKEFCEKVLLTVKRFLYTIDKAIAVNNKI